MKIDASSDPTVGALCLASFLKSLVFLIGHRSVKGFNGEPNVGKKHRTTLKKNVTLHADNAGIFMAILSLAKEANCLMSDTLCTRHSHPLESLEWEQKVFAYARLKRAIHSLSRTRLSTQAPDCQGGSDEDHTTRYSTITQLADPAKGLCLQPNGEVLRKHREPRSLIRHKIQVAKTKKSALKRIRSWDKPHVVLEQLKNKAWEDVRRMMRVGGAQTKVEWLKGNWFTAMCSSSFFKADQSILNSIYSNNLKEVLGSEKQGLQW